MRRTSRAGKERIVGGLNKAVEVAGLKVDKVWGEVIEDRGSQITFSALGQQAPWKKRRMGPRVCQAEEDQGDPGHAHSRVLSPHGRRDVY